MNITIPILINFFESFVELPIMVIMVDDSSSLVKLIEASL